MESVQHSSPLRKGLPAFVAAFPLLLGIVIVAATLLANDGSSHGERRDSFTSTMVFDEDGQCHLVTPSCTELLTASTVSFVSEAPVSITPDLAVQAVTPFGGNAPSEALLLLPSPPPRFA